MIAAEKLSRVYRRGSEEVKALHDITFEIKEGEIAGILGPSGSGKTTLMNLIGLLDKPTGGKLIISGKSADTMDKENMLRARRDIIGFIFQQFLLVPSLTSLQNVMLPMYFAGKSNARRKAMTLLEKVGLGDRHDHLPSEMSGGEMQRVAIARALANDPALLLADEPTGNLDSGTAGEIYKLFSAINTEGKTVVIVTHNSALAESLPRTITLQDGSMIADVKKTGDIYSHNGITRH